MRGAGSDHAAKPIIMGVRCFEIDFQGVRRELRILGSKNSLRPRKIKPADLRLVVDPRHNKLPRKTLWRVFVFAINHVGAIGKQGCHGVPLNPNALVSLSATWHGNSLRLVHDAMQWHLARFKRGGVFTQRGDLGGWRIISGIAST